MSFYSEAYLVVFTAVWAFLLIGLGIMVRKRDGGYHEVDSTPWLLRLIFVGVLTGAFVFSVIFPQYPPLASSAEGKILYLFYSLTPFQIIVDAIGAFILHRKGRHRLERVLAWNFVVILPYLALPPFLVYEYLAGRRERLAQLRLKEFAETLQPWMRLTLLSLNRHGWAKRRRDLKLTRKRSLVLAKMGLAEENGHGTLGITELGRVVVKIIAGRGDTCSKASIGR